MAIQSPNHRVLLNAIDSVKKNCDGFIGLFTRSAASKGLKRSLILGARLLNRFGAVLTASKEIQRFNSRKAWQICTN